MNCIIFGVFLLAVIAWAVGIYTLFALAVWRNGTTQDKKRIRVSIVYVVGIMTFIVIPLVVAVWVSTRFDNQVVTPPPPPALTIGTFMLGLTAASAFGIAVAAVMILITVLTAWRIRREFDIVVEAAWFEWGWRRWLGRDLPDSHIRPIIH